MAVDLMNTNLMPLEVFRDTEAILDVRFDENSAAVSYYKYFSPQKAVKYMIEFADEGYTYVMGFPNTQSALRAAEVGSVYEVAQLSSLASSHSLSNDVKYPYFSRISPVSYGFLSSLKDLLLYYAPLGGQGWTDVAIIASTNPFTISLAQTLVEILKFP